MEYTNDVILNVQYKKDEVKSDKCVKHKRLSRIKKKIENDEYFTLTIVISIIVLFIDYLVIKEFVDIINLL